MKKLIAKLLTLLQYIFSGLALLSGLGFIIFTITFSYKMHGVIAAIISAVFIPISPWVYLVFAWGKYESMINPYSTEQFLSIAWCIAMWGLVFLFSSLNDKLKR